MQPIHSVLHPRLPWQENERFERNQFVKKKHFQFNVGLIVVVGFSNTTPSAQYIRDENGKLLRKLDEIRARWRRYFTSLLNTTSVTLNRTIIEGLSQKPTTLSLGDLPAVSEIKKGPEIYGQWQGMGPDELPAELLKLGLSDSSHEILLAFHDIIVAVWMTEEVPQEWKDATIKVLHKKDGSDRV